MSSTFASRFDSFYSTITSQSSYQEVKGYYQDGDYTFWAPTDPIDLETDTYNDRVSSMAAGASDKDNGSAYQEF